ncbi:hypothetical protein [Nitrincola sp. MINF-07-Sa-05]|uniref:hypothetical protein n=1 Tax=Nitrincola salilacus TaxID=3400273 RepID=UPI003918336D
MFKRQLKRPTKPMPEFQLLPTGSWHFIAAVMLIIFCVFCTGEIIIYFLNLDPQTKNIAFIELGIVVALGFVLSHLSFMVTRGSIFCYGLLLKYNHINMLVLLVGNIVALISGDYGTAVLAAAGLALGLLARRFYLSQKYLKFLEFQEVVWSHYRWNRRYK